jgi:phosphatidylserine/phosphatidylglycerophosphate/cardiolipin synthase-like enzyme
MAGSVSIKTYLSPTCVLLTYNWEDGVTHGDFLGFAIHRTPGYGNNAAGEYLTNKLDFTPQKPDAKPKTTDKAPIQKFNWWDGGIRSEDRGKTFKYRITPVRGTGASNLNLDEAAAGEVSVTIPLVEADGIASYFNRAVVSSQAFLAQNKKPLEKQMDWLANGIQEAVPQALTMGQKFDCAIYHLSDTRWILPAFEKYKGIGSLTYFSKPRDTKSDAAVAWLRGKHKVNISVHKRDKSTGLMHDKFVVAYKGGKAQSVLMGSMNFTPEAQTVQANVLHIFNSPQLAALYAERAHILAGNPTKKQLPQKPNWAEVHDISKTKARVFFLPEPGQDRHFLDTVVQAVHGAKSSVLFCMFTATDTELMKAIFAVGDAPDKLIYGLLNSIDDPSAPTKSGKPRKSSPVAVEIFHRSTTEKNPIPFAAFGKVPPQGWLPELRGIDTSKYDVSAKGALKAKGTKGKTGGPPPVHIHHKFIVIDGDTDHPTIYTGSPNFSKNSENANDENVLELKDNLALGHVYVAEFLRLYNHYRARALWEAEHGPKAKTKASSVLVLKTTRDEWVKDAYHPASKAFLARTRGL